MRTPKNATTPSPLAPTVATREPAAGASGHRRLSSYDLLAGRIEVEIEHRSQIYRLRATASGKLILTK